MKWSKKKCLSTRTQVLNTINVNGADHDVEEDFQNRLVMVIGSERVVVPTFNEVRVTWLHCCKVNKEHCGGLEGNSRHSNYTVVRRDICTFMA